MAHQTTKSECRNDERMKSKTCFPRVIRNIATLFYQVAIQRFSVAKQLAIPDLIALRLLLLLGLWRLKEREILTVAFFFQLLDRNKTQRRGVHAETFAGRCGTIIEHMTEMRIAHFSSNLSAFHSMG